jgi:hypothetical protein
MDINRRDLLQSSLILLAGAALPIPAGASGLTDIDRIILKSVATEGTYNHEYEVSQVQVDRRLYNRMSIDYIDSARIKPLDQEPDENGYITYYRIEYYDANSRRPDLVSAGRCGSGSLSQMDAWVARKRREI